MRTIRVNFPPTFHPLFQRIRFTSVHVRQTRYAAYTLEDGSMIGDKANLDVTAAVIRIGWVPPEPKGHFDPLPCVIEDPSGEIRMFDVPPEYTR